MAWLRSCLDIVGHNGHDARIPNPQTSLVDTLSTSSPRESESSLRSEVACRTLAVAVGSRGTAHTSRLRSSTDGQCIAGDGACKIAAWQSTLCADPRDVEMMWVGTSSRRCTPASSGYRSWLAWVCTGMRGVVAQPKKKCGAPDIGRSELLCCCVVTVP
ncbi:hypothetical protein C8Q72DRAFT_57727 [Fomitopsis betulina]|nr:hypothetical protein C8Q72DRAFT_57727 [Fomitopsis betulina]